MHSTTIVGALIASVGCLASAFTQTVGQLCVTFGVVAGFGLALVFVPAIIVVAFYFEKHRAFATGNCSAGAGAVLASPLWGRAMNGG